MKKFAKLILAVMVLSLVAGPMAFADKAPAADKKAEVAKDAPKDKAADKKPAKKAKKAAKKEEAKKEAPAAK